MGRDAVLQRSLGLLGVNGFGADGNAPNPMVDQSSNLVPTVSAHRLTSKLPFGS
jgi:hypothetical protein